MKLLTNYYSYCLLSLLIPGFSFASEDDKHATASIVIVVDRTISGGIRTKLNRFKKDLENDGYLVIENSSRFSSPTKLRDYLIAQHKSNKHELKGAILVGKIPYAYQQITTFSTNPKFPSKTYEIISYQYYCDLDGDFKKSKAYKSQGNHKYSYDIHSGNMDWEIWSGALPYYKGSIKQSAKAINRYFDKNHAYRTGEVSLPRKFAEITEHFSAENEAEYKTFHDLSQNGPYAWSPFCNDSNSMFYIDGDALKNSTRVGYEALSDGAADFYVISNHGTPLSDGRLTVPWIEENGIKTHFYWSDGCAIGNLDVPNNFLTEVAYNPKSMAVFARGSTHNSGGMGTNENGFFGKNIATSLSKGKCFGDAILEHVNVPLKWPWSKGRELHFGPHIVIGDPSLRLIRDSGK